MGGRGASAGIPRLRQRPPHEYRKIATLDPSKIKGYSKRLSTDEVVLTNERAIHIHDQRAKDYDQIIRNMPDTISNPTYIFEDRKNPDTLIYVRKIRGKNQNVVIKLSLKDDKTHPKNSVITSYFTSDKRLRRLAKINKMVYNEYGEK